MKSPSSEPTHISRRMLGYLLSAAVLILVLALGLRSLANPPHGVDPVKPINPQKILGPWFEIARLDNALEAGHRPSLLLYRKGNRQFKLILTKTNVESNPDKIWQKIADWTGSPDTGSITVDCLGLLRCGFHIIALDTDRYQWMMVTGPTRDYLWIFARVPGLEQAKLDELRTLAEERGYDAGALVMNNFPVPFPAVLPKLPEKPPRLPQIKAKIPPRPGLPPMPEQGPSPMPEQGPPPLPEQGPPPMPEQGPPPMPEEGPPPMRMEGPPPMPGPPMPP